MSSFSQIDTSFLCLASLVHGIQSNSLKGNTVNPSSLLLR